MTRVLITGLTGLVGSHLADYLISQPGVEVYGFKRWRSSEQNVAHLRDRVEMIEGDIEDGLSVDRALELAQPDRIFHLAAQSYPRESWEAPIATFNANVLGTINLLEGVRRQGLHPAIHIACSSAEYGLVRPEDVPIREDHPLRPLSPYGVSKVAQELLGYQYWANYGLRTFMTRSFNHVGPRQGDRCSVQTFCRQVAEAEAGLREPVVQVGNLTPRRDFSDVRDVVRALWLLTEKGEPGESYNLCSGLAPSIQEVLDVVLELARVRMEVHVDPARLRPADEPILLGDCSKLQRHTGWWPQIPLRQSVADILDYWRLRVQAEQRSLAEVRG